MGGVGVAAGQHRGVEPEPDWIGGEASQRAREVGRSRAGLSPGGAGGEGGYRPGAGWAGWGQLGWPAAGPAWLTAGPAGPVGGVLLYFFCSVSFFLLFIFLFCLYLF